jgi:DNA-binding transcriptional ArsR family regulator
MVTTFDVLAEPTRRRILDLLLERPRLVGDLTEALGLSQPGTSKHLRVLRDAGLVRVRPEAQRRWYELRPEPLADVDAWLAPYRRLWKDSLDALERHLDAMPDDVADAATALGVADPDDVADADDLADIAAADPHVADVAGADDPDDIAAADDPDFDPLPEEDDL